MVRKITFIVTFILIYVDVISQECTGTIYGFDGSFANGALVYNKSNKLFTYANSLGQFSIMANSTDTIIVRHISFKRSVYKLNVSVLQKKVKIVLPEKTYAIPEITFTLKAYFNKLLKTAIEPTTEVKNSERNTKAIAQQSKTVVKSVVPEPSKSKFPSSKLKEIPTFSINALLYNLRKKK